MSELVLLSGGLDSALCLWMANDPTALFVHYGQPAAALEHQAAVALASARGCPLLVAAASLDIGEMGDGPGEEGPRVVHGRNMALVALGVNAAASRGLGAVWIGCNAGDAANYPDCRPEFLRYASELATNAYRVAVCGPCVTMSREQVAQKAAELGVPVDLCWSCYAAVDGKPCGTCDSCRQ